jgi:hypothetical protein
MRDALSELDTEFGRVVDKLASLAGKDGYVIAITADHGMPPERAPELEQPYVEDLDTLLSKQFKTDVGLMRFPDAGDNQIYVNVDSLETKGVRLEDVARFLEQRYTKDIRFAIPEAEVRAAQEKLKKP